jgi:hypothetical protein
MKKLSVLILVLFLCAPLSYSQFLERFEALNEVNIKEYTQPFATSFGLFMNSGGFHTADVSSIFGFSLSFKGMYILIPENAKTYTPVLSAGYSPGEVATIYGDKGGAFAGPGGYQVTPPGINKSAIPLAYPQVAVSLMGTEILLRYLPNVKFSSEHDVNLLGIGVRHSVSQYFPMFPIDLAVQVLYNNLEISNLMKSNNLAFNIHASRTFVILTPYIGLQYESSTLELDYTYKPQPGVPAFDQRLNVKIDGDNSFRGIIGTSLNLGLIVFSIDAGISSQTVLTAGLSFGI